MTTPRSPGRLRLSLIVFAIAMGFALLEVAQARVLHSRYPWHEYLPEALLRVVPSWLILAALMPAISWLARVARVSRETWRTAIPIHFLAAVAFSLIRVTAASWFDAWRHHGPLWIYFVPTFSHFFVSNVFTFGAISAGLHAYHYQAEARERALAASRLQAGLARAKLQFLQAQLRPHFLFNALNSISSLALTGERERVAQTVSHLSELLRRSLDESIEQEVALGVEVEIVEHYLELESVRFGDRLTVEWRIDPDTLDVRVPSLLLQTLVENAVAHGIEARRGPGRLVIEARRDGNDLRLEVRDTGPGFRDGAASRGRGIGLANSSARLEQLYGDAARLERGVAPEGGARVTVRVPWDGPAPAGSPA